MMSSGVLLIGFLVVAIVIFGATGLRFLGWGGLILGACGGAYLLWGNPSYDAIIVFPLSALSTIVGGATILGRLYCKSVKHN